MSFELTRFQKEEVAGLLAVCADEAAVSGERKPWGELAYQEGQLATLTVTDAADAVDDLRRRADYLVSEAAVAGENGEPGARSLRTLAARIEKA